MGSDMGADALQQRVDRLWAMQEIRNLPLRYAYAVDTRDWALMNALWVETDERAPDNMLEGGRILDIHVMRTIGPRFADSGPSTLLVANHLIDFDGEDRAHGAVYCHCQMERGGAFFEQMILYKDIYERHDGRWLFRTRDHLLWWGAERPDDPTRQAPAHWPASQIGAGVAFEHIRHG